MTNTISKTSMVEDIWRNFYDRIKDQVTSLTITSEPYNLTIQGYHNSYSDEIIDKKTNYPFIIIEDPKLSTEQFTMSRTQVDGTIMIEVFTTQSQSASKYLSKILDAVETYKSSLSDIGITMIDLDSTDSDMFMRGLIKVHYRSAVFKFKYRYNRTGSS